MIAWRNEPGPESDAVDTTKVAAEADHGRTPAKSKENALPRPGGDRKAKDDDGLDIKLN